MKLKELKERVIKRANKPMRGRSDIKINEGHVTEVYRALIKFITHTTTRNDVLYMKYFILVGGDRYKRNH